MFSALSKHYRLHRWRFSRLQLLLPHIWARRANFGPIDRKEVAERETPVTKKRIATFGLFGGGNLGNEGSLEAVLQMLRHVQPKAELWCICAKPSNVVRDHGIPALPIRTMPPVDTLSRGLMGRLWKVVREVIDWPATFLRVRRFSVVIVPGTGILDDFGERPWGTPLLLLRLCLMARLARTKVWLVSVGAGPIRHPLSRWMMLQAARLTEYRSFRDAGSRDYMRSIGLETNSDEIYPDVAFALPTPVAPCTSMLSRPADPVTIGVGVMAYRGWKGGAMGPVVYRRYVSILTSVLIRLLGRGFRVRLIMGETSDERAVADLRKAVVEELPHLESGQLVADAARSLHDVMRQMADCDAVIATRFHNVICALRMGKPTISIGYASKFDELMRDMGLSAYCQDVERLDVGKLERQLDCVLANREEISSAVRTKVRDYRQRLRRQHDALSHMLARTSDQQGLSDP